MSQFIVKTLIPYQNQQKEKKFRFFWLSWQELRREIANLEKELKHSLLSLNRLRQKIPAL